MFSGIKHTNFQNNHGNHSILESSPTLDYKAGALFQTSKTKNNADTLQTALSENVAVLPLPFSLSLQKLTPFIPHITRQLYTDFDLRAY